MKLVSVFELRGGENVPSMHSEGVLDLLSLDIDPSAWRYHFNLPGHRLIDANENSRNLLHRSTKEL
jgi:hypothetical protein